MAMKLPNSAIVGVDRSLPALALARATAITMSGMLADYRHLEVAPLPLPDAAFSHAVCLHPFSDASAAAALDDVREAVRTEIVRDARRLLAPSGQLLLALPLRGSYGELFDLLREFALKVDDAAFGASVERAAASTPTPETLSEELERAGFEYVDVTTRREHLAFASAREMLEDPIFRLAILPELRGALGMSDLDRALTYAREAIDRYWSDGSFSVTLHIGCASARRPAATA
jgi:SAM-dependent methyltransferase